MAPVCYFRFSLCLVDRKLIRINEKAGWFYFLFCLSPKFLIGFAFRPIAPIEDLNSFEFSSTANDDIDMLTFDISFFFHFPRHFLPFNFA